MPLSYVLDTPAYVSKTGRFRTAATGRIGALAGLPTPSSTSSDKSTYELLFLCLCSAGYAAQDPITTERGHPLAL